MTRDHFRDLETGHVSKSLAYASSSGILEKVPPYERVLKLESVRFWCTQLNKSGHRRTSPICGTKQLYLSAIVKFDRWLLGKSFQAYETVIRDGQIVRQPATKSFEKLIWTVSFPSFTRMPCVDEGASTKAAASTHTAL